MCLKNLWHRLQAYHQPGNLVPFPTYVLIAFASPILTHHILMEQGVATRVIGRCLEALVVKELVSGIKPNTNSNVQVHNDKLAWLSVILRTESEDVQFCLACPGFIELVTMASIALGDVSPLAVNVLPSDVHDVAQHTLAILSRTARPLLDQPISQLDTLDAKLENVIVSGLHKFLQMCRPGTLTAQVRRSCLRMCLKSLWYCAKAYHQLSTFKPLPSYFPITLASREITNIIWAEQDPVSRVVGRCFNALVVMKLVADIRLRTDSDDRVSVVEQECLSAILKNEPWPLLKQPGAIELVNIVLLAFDDVPVGFSPTDTIPLYILNVIPQTFSILSQALPAEIDTQLGLDQIDTLADIPDGRCELILHLFATV
jgi:hypothetical protein